MGIYKDIANTQKLVGSLLGEAATAQVTDTRDAVNKLYDILKTLRAIEYTIRNDDKVANEVYLNKIKVAIESAQESLNSLEPIADDLEELGF